MLPPNRMTAYKQARAAERPKGMGYTELFFDNVIGLDNNYESSLEDTVDAYNADKMGFLRNAAVGAYEGVKTAVMNPLTTAEGLISGLYDSGANVLSTLGPGGEAEYLDSALMDMFGVSYEQATDDQVSKAREALFGDVLNVGSVASGIGAGAKLAGGLKAGSRAAAATALPEPSPHRELASLVGRAYRGEPLTNEEAFDVLTYERYGPDGVYDPTNTYENWTTQAGDNEGALRIAHLTGPMPGVGQNPVRRVPGPYFADEIQAPDDLIDVEDIDWDAYDAAQQTQLAAQTPVRELLLRQAEGQDMTPAELQRITEYEAQRLDPWANVAQEEPNEPTDFFQQPAPPPPTPRLAPAVNKVEGIAALYSPTRKAVDLLDRQQYDNIDSLRVQLLNRGAKPDEVERVISRIGETSGPVSKDRLATLADEQAGELGVRRINADNTPYGTERNFVTGYFVPGAENLQANVLELPVVNKPDFSEAHFSGSSPEAAPVMHTRTGMLSTKGANKPDSYHVGEIQSDWAQKRAKLFTNDADAEKARDRLDVVRNEQGDIYQKQMDREREVRDAGGSPYNDVEWNRLQDEANKFTEEQNALYGRLQDHWTYGTRERFDLDYPAPYVGTTSKWVQLGLRQSLVDAVNSGARQMSISTGEMVKDYTYGSLKGQQKFYDEIVPKELNEVLKKFAKEAGIKKPEVVMDTVFGAQGQAYTVPVLKFTDEFIDAIKRNGLPAFAKGGIVQGSLLDVDLFGDGT